MEYRPSNFAVVAAPRVQSHIYRARPGAKVDSRKASLRVSALALGAVILTISAAGLTSKAFWEVSHHRYADEVLRSAL